MQAYVYLMASQRNGTLYTGVTTNLVQRVYQHKNKLITECFTADYNVTMLVYYEVFDDLTEARQRELRLKKWNRSWKLRIIEEKNPEWKDLYSEIV